MRAGHLWLTGERRFRPPSPLDEDDSWQRPRDFNANPPQCYQRSSFMGKCMTVYLRDCQSFICETAVCTVHINRPINENTFKINKQYCCFGQDRVHALHCPKSRRYKSEPVTVWAEQLNSKIKCFLNFSFILYFCCNFFDNILCMQQNNADPVAFGSRCTGSHQVSGSSELF